jgi:hypothetical protein
LVIGELASARSRAAYPASIRVGDPASRLVEIDRIEIETIRPDRDTPESAL